MTNVNEPAGMGNVVKIHPDVVPVVVGRTDYGGFVVRYVPFEVAEKLEK